MSDVTPEELRALANELAAEGDAHFGNETAKLLRRAGRKAQQAADALQAAEADRDALARKIAAAPHADDCVCSDPQDMTGNCDCWKADTGDAAHQGHE